MTSRRTVRPPPWYNNAMPMQPTRKLPAATLALAALLLGSYLLLSLYHNADRTVRGPLALDRICECAGEYRTLPRGETRQQRMKAHDVRDDRCGVAQRLEPDFNADWAARRRDRDLDRQRLRAREYCRDLAEPPRAVVFA